MNSTLLTRTQECQTGANYWESCFVTAQKNKNNHVTVKMCSGEKWECVVDAARRAGYHPYHIMEGQWMMFAAGR